MHLPKLEQTSDWLEIHFSRFGKRKQANINRGRGSNGKSEGKGIIKNKNKIKSEGKGASCHLLFFALLVSPCRC